MTDEITVAAPSVAPSTEFGFTPGRSYLALPRDPKPWLIERLVPSGGMMNLYGKPKLGKSYMALGIALAVADSTVDQWLGFTVVKHGPVFYLQADTPRSEWADRIDRLATNGHNIDNVYFADSINCPYPIDLTNVVQREALQAAVEKIKPVLLVVDTLREIHDGDENKSDAMKVVVGGLVACTRSTNTSLLIVSHSRKDQALGNQRGGMAAEDNIMDDGRGSGYVSGRMDVVAKLTEKRLLLKGRSIAKTIVPVEQDPTTYMFTQDADKAESDANIRFVLTQPNLSINARAALLAGMEDIEPEPARARIRRYLKKHGGLATTAKETSDDTTAET